MYYGNKISAETLELYDNNLTGSEGKIKIRIKDDGAGSLYRADCKTKHARGELGSYPIEDIVARAKQSFKEGVVEIWLTSEDTGAYGRDIGVTLPELLWELVKVIPDGCRLRLGMTNPPYILDHLDDNGQIQG